jgi:hypothetical protein
LPRPPRLAALCRLHSLCVRIDLFAFVELWQRPDGLSASGAIEATEGWNLVASKTQQAFDKFRSRFPEKPCDMSRIANDDELRRLTPEEGLQTWDDGPDLGTTDGTPPVVDGSKVHLWVVKSDEVVHAREHLPIAQELQSKIIKHSNLTGGSRAHCGGELVFASAGEIVLNGSSGRYGPGSESEMNAVAKAFKESGYGVWSYGWDQSIDKPFAFRDTRNPERVK